MAQVFLSYAREDRERAKTLARVLESESLSVWWDRSIPAGKAFAQVIEEELSKATCVMVLWTRDSVSSNWVLEEAEEGRKRRVLIPVLMDDVNLPLGFRSIQAADLIGWRGNSDSEGLSKLISDVQLLVEPKGVEDQEQKLPRSENMASVTQPAAPERREGIRAIKYQKGPKSLLLLRDELSSDESRRRLVKSIVLSISAALFVSVFERPVRSILGFDLDMSLDVSEKLLINSLMLVSVATCFCWLFAWRKRVGAKDVAFGMLLSLLLSFISWPLSVYWLTRDVSWMGKIVLLNCILGAVIGVILSIFFAFRVRRSLRWAR